MNITKQTPSRLALAAMIAALAFGPGSAPAQNDEDEPPPAPAQDQGQFVMADENFDQWVFQSRPAAGAREWFETRLAQQINDVDMACRLDEAQKAKLRLAGRGDVKRFYDLLEEKRRRFQLVKRDQNKINEIFQEIQPLQATLEAGPFGEGSLFVKAIRTTLNPSQTAEYDKILADRSAFRYRARIGLVVAMFDGVLGMTEKQREQFTEVLIAETKPPKRAGQYEYYLILYLAAHVPEDKLRPIFDAAQWRVLGRQLQQAKGYASFLKQAGLLDGTDEEKAAAKAKGAEADG